jgi:hypothetical protein
MIFDLQKVKHNSYLILKDQIVVRTIKKCVIRLIQVSLAQDTDRWRALVNTVMNVRFAKILGIYLFAEWLSASREGPCSMESIISIYLCYYYVPSS